MVYLGLFACLMYSMNAFLADISGDIRLKRERSLFMARVGTEEKVLYALKKTLPHHLLKSKFLYPIEGK